MSVRSVDMQNVVARSHEAERVQRIVQQTPSVAQEEFATRLASEAARRAGRVETGQRPAGLAVRDREGGKEKGGGGRRDAEDRERGTGAETGTGTGTRAGARDSTADVGAVTRAVSRPGLVEPRGPRNPGGRIDVKV